MTSLFDDLFYDNPTYSVVDALEYAQSEYEQAFERYWGLSDTEPPEHLTWDQWRSLVDLRRLAVKLAAGAASLVRPPKLREEQLSLPEVLREEATSHQRTVDELMDKVKDALPEDRWWQIFFTLQPYSADDPRTKRAFFRNCLQLEVMKLFPFDAYASADRMETLVGHMLRTPGEFTRAYLSRVAECYVRDMKPEFAVMARAVLDSAIQEVLSDDEVVGVVGTRGAVTLERRIEACRTRGWFDSNLYSAATRIRGAGKQVAHFSPGLEGDVDNLLVALVEVLRKLEMVAK